MMFTIPLRFVFILSVITFLRSAWADIILVQNGVPRATIVTGADVRDQVRDAAQELQSYIFKISGATLPIVTENEAVNGTRILVGRSRAVDELGIDVPSGFTTQLNEEGYVIKTVDGDLILAGNEDRDYRGTAFAVFDFLEQLGCRWYFPGEFGKVLPSMDTIIIPEMDRVERPDFRVRNIGYSGWMPISTEDQKAYQIWYDRHKLSRLSVSMPGDGSVKRLVPPEKYFESHPHMFAIDRHGERFEGMLCMTDPEALAVSIEAIKKYFRENPYVHSFGFAPADGYARTCYCENCRRLLPGFAGKGIGEPSVSDVWFRFANTIAEEICKEFPERWVLTNGYANRVRLPESLPKLSPNLGIQLATIHICSFHRIGDPHCWERLIYKQLLDRWTDAVECVIIYDYDPGIALDNLPFPALHNLKHDMPYFKKRGIWGFWTHASNSWMVTHLNYYIRAKLMWDTTMDIDSLVQDYCQRFYGPAAKPVEDYIWILESALENTQIHAAWGDVIPWSIILTPVLDDLDQLVTKAGIETDGTEFAKRVHILRLVHDHMKTYVAMENSLADADFQQAVEWINHMLSLRDAVCAIQSGLLPHTADFAKDFRTALEWHHTLYEDLAAKAGGDQGELIMNLPKIWEFKKDPEDIGTIYQWYLPENGDGWEPINTTLYWEAQGHANEKGWGYWGKAWFRTQFDVPADAVAKPITLTIGGVYNTLDHNQGPWIWVNGQLINWQYHPMGGLKSLKPIHADVTNHVYPGETNTVAVLVHTDPPDRFPRGGIHRRSFLWKPSSSANKTSEHK